MIDTFLKDKSYVASFHPGFHNLLSSEIKAVSSFASDGFTSLRQRFIKGQTNKLTHNCGSFSTKENRCALKMGHCSDLKTNHC